MFMAVETNWWPGKVPTPVRDDLVDGPPLGLSNGGTWFNDLETSEPMF
jgi:hypothetical protein